MENRTVSVPTISCGHCTHTIETELSELEGVTLVKADRDTKKVAVQWQAPATWEKIDATLKAINFPAAE